MTRHRADLVSLFGGLVALTFGLLLLTGGIGDLPMQWFGPVAAIGIGLVIVFAVLPTREPAEDGAARNEDA